MYTIKRASEMVGVPVATLRAWQRRYRVVEPRRSDSGYRLYSAADIAKLRSMQAFVASGWSPKEAAAVVSADADLETEPDDLERDQTPLAKQIVSTRIRTDGGPGFGGGRAGSFRGHPVAR